MIKVICSRAKFFGLVAWLGLIVVWSEYRHEVLVSVVEAAGSIRLERGSSGGAHFDH